MILHCVKIICDYNCRIDIYKCSKSRFSLECLIILSDVTNFILKWREYSTNFSKTSLPWPTYHNFLKIFMIPKSCFHACGQGIILCFNFQTLMLTIYRQRVFIWSGFCNGLYKLKKIASLYCTNPLELLYCILQNLFMIYAQWDFNCETLLTRS